MMPAGEVARDNDAYLQPETNDFEKVHHFFRIFLSLSCDYQRKETHQLPI